MAINPRRTVIALDDLPTLHQKAVLKPKKGSKGELLLVLLLLVIAFVMRFYAALHTGLEVDEPIYRDAAAQVLNYGYPVIRPTYLHPITPFLYHPPFYLLLLAGWFKLWNNTSYFTGRMFSISVSIILLLTIYLCIKDISNKRIAFFALLFVASDPWITFTNQAIYLENSLSIFSLLAVWAYWRAMHIPNEKKLLLLRWYAFAGLLAGWSIIYKQIGGYIALVFILNLVIQRKHWLGHIVLYTVMGLVALCYVAGMHHIFGSVYDAATIDQIHRTFGMKAAPGLNTGFAKALQTAWNQYWMFLVTILALVGGSGLAFLRYAQEVFRRRVVSYDTVIVSWALGGIIFALGISLKSPHYLILWLIPLYVFLAHEIVRKWDKRDIKRWRFMLVRVGLSLLVLIGICVGDIWGFQNRFTHAVGDTLLESEVYIDETLPPDALVLTENYIGVDIEPPFLDIALVNTPQQVLKENVQYIALYWSSTQPIPASLGPVNQYCLPMKKFSGFKDFVEVCKIDPVALASVVGAHKK